VSQVDFYQLRSDPVERVVPLLAIKAIERGDRLLVVSGDSGQRAALSEALWARENSFIAHGEAGEPHAERQPVLLAASCEAANGAGTAILADGEWRDEAGAFARAVLLFGPEQTEAARGLWGSLSGSGHTLRIFKQGDDGGWRAGR
jgi:DNA polymerase-3 subunit chi